MAGETELVDIEMGVNPFRRHPGSGGFSHHGPVLFAPDRGSLSDANVAAHELSHFWLHSSTPYGLVLDELSEIQTMNALRYCESFHQSDERVPIAAVDLGRAVLNQELESTRFPHLADAITNHVVPWTHDVFLELWLEGANTKSVREGHLPKILRWLVDFEERSRAFRPDEHLFEDVPRSFSDYQRTFVRWWADWLDRGDIRSGSAYPTISSTSGEREPEPFGARHLMEAQAQLAEHPDGDFWRGADTALRRLYWGTFASFVGRFPGEADTDEGFQSLASTFAALVELALFTPVGRVYGRFREDSMTWLDLHPGWRYIRLVNTLKDQDWIEGIDEAAPRLQWQLSRRLRWPAPDRFLELGAELSPVTGELTRHAAACRRRLEEPDRLVYAVAMDADRVGEFLNSYGPILIRESSSAVIGSTVKERLQRLLSYALATVAWNVMRQGQLRREELFPPGLDFANVFDNIKSQEEFMPMLYEALPYLQDDAFCPVEELLEGSPSVGNDNDNSRSG